MCTERPQLLGAQYGRCCVPPISTHLPDTVCALHAGVVFRVGTYTLTTSRLQVDGDDDGCLLDSCTEVKVDFGSFPCFSANIFVTQMLTDRTKQIFQTQMLTDCMSNVVYRNMNHGRGKFRLIQNWSRNFLSLPWRVPHPFGAPITECGNLCKSDHTPL